MTVGTLAITFFVGWLVIEERALRSAFPDYADYSVRVRRFLPLVW